jgi:hypothetical protein
MIATLTVAMALYATVATVYYRKLHAIRTPNHPRKT